MTDKFSQFLGESNLSEETKQVIVEAWNSKLSEAREEIRAELREEFAAKFEHDKDVIVESMQQFLTNAIADEIQELAEDKKQQRAAIVESRRTITEKAEKMEKFVVEALAREVKEHRDDIKAQKNALKTFESFVLTELARELADFQEDKNALREERVALIKEGKKSIAAAKRTFVERAAAQAERGINEILAEEIATFRNDITEAKQNEFGRKVFEAFAAEYMTSQLNEGSIAKSFKTKVAEIESKLAEAQEQLVAKDALLVETAKKAAIANDRLVRAQKMQKLLSPLNKEASSVMSQLLESVKTADLDKAYTRYLPAVLNENRTTHAKPATRNNLTESSTRSQTITEKTGDRASVADESVAEIASLKKLAGVNKT